MEKGMRVVDKTILKLSTLIREKEDLVVWWLNELLMKKGPQPRTKFSYV